MFTRLRALALSLSAVAVVRLTVTEELDIRWVKASRVVLPCDGLDVVKVVAWSQHALLEAQAVIRSRGHRWPIAAQGQVVVAQGSLAPSSPVGSIATL